MNKNLEKKMKMDIENVNSTFCTDSHIGLEITLYEAWIESEVMLLKTIKSIFASYF